MKQAGIYVNDIYCGTLTEDEEGFHFVYDEAYLARQDAKILRNLPTVGGNHQEVLVSTYAGCAAILGDRFILMDYWKLRYALQELFLVR